MNNKRRGHGKRKNTGVNTQETDDGCGSGSNGADGQTVDGLIVIGSDFEVRAVDENEGRVVGDVEIDYCRSRSLSGDASA
jgi:hypothetical protein